jgi:hypothetical protein
MAQIWMAETDWLVEVVSVPDGDPDNDKTLNYIGRLLAFAYATDTRVLAQ